MKNETWNTNKIKTRNGWVGGAYFLYFYCFIRCLYSFIFLFLFVSIFKIFSRVSIKHYMSVLFIASAGVHMQIKQRDSKFLCTCVRPYIVTLTCFMRGGLTACQHIYIHYWITVTVAVDLWNYFYVTVTVDAPNQKLYLIVFLFVYLIIIFVDIIIIILLLLISIFFFNCLLLLVFYYYYYYYISLFNGLFFIFCLIILFSF